MSPNYHVNQDVEIVVLPSAAKKSYGARDSKKIQDLVRTHLLRPRTEPYHKVQAVVKHSPDGVPEAVVATMLRAYTYTAEIVKLSISPSYEVKGVEASYAGDEEDYAALLPPISSKPRIKPPPKIPKGPDMVFGTPVPEIETARKGVETACKIATQAGYKVVKLLGPDASRANYQQYLSGHLKAFGNIGHGYTGGIVLADGNLTYQWVASLAAKALWPEVIYFNSCQVFNPPLQPAIMKYGARTFVGGRINLLIGPSENVFTCFWGKVLLRPKGPMGKVLAECERQLYPVAGAHGISGDLGKFLPVPGLTLGRPRGTGTRPTQLQV